MDDSLEDFLSDWLPPPPAIEPRLPETAEVSDFATEWMVSKEVTPPQAAAFEALRQVAAEFAARESQHAEPTLYGVTDGKAVGTYLEQKFRALLTTAGSSARGLDLPGLNVDIKATSLKQPQSSCPFKSPRQKIFGLGYSLLVFVYEKTDDRSRKTATLRIQHAVFIDAPVTGDFTTTRDLRAMHSEGATREQVLAYLESRSVFLGSEADAILDDLMRAPPEQGYVTISNALQWRLQYGRAIHAANAVEGVFDVSA